MKNQKVRKAIIPLQDSEHAFYQLLSLGQRNVANR